MSVWSARSRMARALVALTLTAAALIWLLRRSLTVEGAARVSAAAATGLTAIGPALLATLVIGSGVRWCALPIVAVLGLAILGMRLTLR